MRVRRDLGLARSGASRSRIASSVSSRPGIADRRARPGAAADQRDERGRGSRPCCRSRSASRPRRCGSGATGRGPRGRARAGARSRPGSSGCRRRSGRGIRRRRSARAGPRSRRSGPRPTGARHRPRSRGSPRHRSRARRARARRAARPRAARPKCGRRRRPSPAPAGVASATSAGGVLRGRVGERDQVRHGSGGGGGGHAKLPSLCGAA